MSSVPLVNVNLATVCIESMGYGVFLVLATTSMFLRFRHSFELNHHVRRGSMRYAKVLNPMFFGELGLIVVVTAHWTLTCTRLFKAIVFYKGGSNPLEFYADLSQTTEVVKTGFLMASLICGDAMMIYRLWVVWGHRKWIVVFPMCTLAGLIACGVGITYQFTQYVPGEDVFNSAAGRWITSDCVFTLGTNLYSTALIAWRMWTINRNSKDYRVGSPIMAALAIWVESAAIYTSWTIFFFASYQSHSNLQFVAVDVWPLSSGISFVLINVRVGLGWAQKTLLQDTGTSNSSYRLRAVNVNITQTVEHEEERDVEK